MIDHQCTSTRDFEEAEGTVTARCDLYRNHPSAKHLNVLDEMGLPVFRTWEADLGFNTELVPPGWFFGAWERVGHLLRHERYSTAPSQQLRPPWGYSIDGLGNDQREHYWRPDGEALVFHKDGWTALWFNDRSVDTRPGSNSSFIFEGVYTFDQMVQLAKERFPKKFNSFPFEIVEGDQ